MFRTLLYVVGACIVTTADAQQVTREADGGGSPRSALTYDSAFDSYRVYQEQSLADWRTVNEDVGNVGGHAGVVRGADSGDPAAAKSSSSAGEAGRPPVRGAPKTPAAGSHAGHH